MPKNLFALQIYYDISIRIGLYLLVVILMNNLNMRPILDHDYKPRSTQLINKVMVIKMINSLWDKIGSFYQKI